MLFRSPAYHASQLARKLVGEAREWLILQDPAISREAILQGLLANFGERYADGTHTTAVFLLTPADTANGAQRERALLSAFKTLRDQNVPFSLGFYELLCGHYLRMIPPSHLHALFDNITADPDCNDMALLRVPVEARQRRCGEHVLRYIVTSAPREAVHQARFEKYILPYLQRLPAPRRGGGAGLRVALADPVAAAGTPGGPTPGPSAPTTLPLPPQLQPQGAPAAPPQAQRAARHAVEELPDRLTQCPTPPHTRNAGLRHSVHEHRHHGRRIQAAPQHLQCLGKAVVDMHATRHQIGRAHV